MGIRGQLLCLYAVVAWIVGFAAVAALRWQSAEEFTEFRERQQRVLETIAVPVAVLAAQNDIGALDTLVAELTASMAPKDLLELSVLDSEGRVIADRDARRFNTIPSDLFSKEAFEQEQPIWERVGETLHLAVPARSGIRWGTVVARFSLEQPNAHTRVLGVWWLMSAVLLMAIIAATLYMGLDSFVVRPLHALRRAVRKMGKGHLTAKVPVLKGAELRELSLTINRMAEHILAERRNLEATVHERTKALLEANARLEKTAVTDGLTGLYNHRYFHEVLEAELVRSERHKRPFAVVMLDVDFFKKVNDAKGHPVGDELLRRIAQLLREVLRQTDVIARYGGEEFSAVLPETGKAEAVQVAERIRASIAEQLNLPEVFGRAVTASLGVAVYPEDGLTAVVVLAAADKALYVAKDRGRNQIVASRAA